MILPTGGVKKFRIKKLRGKHGKKHPDRIKAVLRKLWAIVKREVLKTPRQVKGGANGDVH